MGSPTLIILRIYEGGKGEIYKSCDAFSLPHPWNLI